MLIIDKSRSSLSFEEWFEMKREEERRKTHGATPVKEKALYAMEDAVIRFCFDGKLPFMNLYFTPKDLDSGSCGLFGYGVIMISEPYFIEYGVCEETISTMFHECVHAWDAIKGTKDTDGHYHNVFFKKTCEEHGGIAIFRNAEDGYNIAKPTEEKMQRIVEHIHQYSF